MAKSLEDDTSQTRTGTIVGTPNYMAPEQANGTEKSAVGPAADIYALGVILYEMLTGRPPFCARTPLETLDLVRTQEPVPPRHLQPATPRDLETICLQCLAKEPRKRYASALDLADDLARFRAGEPIQARPIGSVERLGRWCRRNPRLAVLQGLIALLLVGIAAGTLFAAQKLRQERDWALANERRADRNLARARKAVEEYCKNVAEDERLKQAKLHSLRRKLLEAAILFYEELVEESANDATLLTEQGRAYQQLGFLRYELGEHQQALEDYKGAVQVFTQLAREHPKEPDHCVALAYNL